MRSQRMACGRPSVPWLKGAVKPTVTVANANSYSTPKVSGGRHYCEVGGWLSDLLVGVLGKRERQEQEAGSARWCKL